jgi:hypothetical protein
MEKGIPKGKEGTSEPIPNCRKADCQGPYEKEEVIRR